MLIALLSLFHSSLLTHHHKFRVIKAELIIFPPNMLLPLYPMIYPTLNGRSHLTTQHWKSEWLCSQFYHQYGTYLEPFQVLRREVSLLLMVDTFGHWSLILSRNLGWERSHQIWSQTATRDSSPSFIPPRGCPQPYFSPCLHIQEVSSADLLTKTLLLHSFLIGIPFLLLYDKLYPDLNPAPSLAFSSPFFKPAPNLIIYFHSTLQWLLLASD